MASFSPEHSRAPTPPVSAGTVSGIAHLSFDQLDSTNAEALRRAAAGEAGPLWITAERQTGGRGRRGRVWVSEPGNLYASLLLRDPSPICQAAQISFVTALAVHDAVAALAPTLAAQLTLKWPNDLLCGGKKIVGILIEGESRHGFAVVIGIGINCGHHPAADTAYPATDLAAEGVSIAPAGLFPALAESLSRRLREWDRGARFAAIRSAWLERGPEVGNALRVRLTNGDVNGRFETMDEQGNLVISTAEGSRKIMAGDVLLPVAPAAEPSP